MAVSSRRSRRRPRQSPSPRPSPTLTYPQTVLDNSPSFFWPLNEASGTDANDASPNGNNGIYESGTTQGVAGPIMTAPIRRPDPATAFDGQSGNVVSATQ